MRRWLQEEAHGHILFVQETGVAPGARAEVEQAVRREGWKASFTEARRTERGGLSSGVGIVCRAHLGMGKPPAGPALPADRMVARWVNAIIPGGFLAVSVYLVATTSGLDPESKVLLAQLGQYLTAVQTPYVISGDWNCAPQELERWGWPNRVSGFVASAGQTTCRVGGGTEIDFSWCPATWGPP